MNMTICQVMIVSSPSMTINTSTSKTFIGEDDDKVREAAESYFKQILKNDTDLSSDEIDEFVENGHYEWSDSSIMSIISPIIIRVL